jgi:hypothetical protein
MTDFFEYWYQNQTANRISQVKSLFNRFVRDQYNRQ